METLLIIITCILGLGEGLSLIPSVKANGIFQLIKNVLGMLVDAISKK